MFILYVVNSYGKIAQRLLLGCNWSLFTAFSISTYYSVLISIYSVFISLFRLTFALFTFILPTSVLFCTYFEGGENICPHFSRVFCILNKCFLRPDLSPVTFLVALCCLIVRRLNLEVAINRLFHQQVKKKPG